ncbi:hypothetical protein Asru_0610_01 [Acidisphaera rubrifaciens HS-AP3]|uniref:Uncharacterized protein n=1 Tax=Acidisphaera rubrifaciens HS-AP3 TaxID=1231350 RepID=A0A0D6P8R7_9PROT|nr:hypothetical protein Asru_0610_01 [Acidisphaera rubrifaciens HS-AP3]
MERGPAAMAGLGAAGRATAAAEIAEAFRWAFLTVAAYAGCAMALAWWVPVRRL